MSTDTERDPGLDAVWREHSTETPPAHVDAAILAAAHREAATGSSTGSRSPAARAWRWWVPLAAAAVIAVVVVGVKPPGQTVVDDAAPRASDMPAAPAEKPTAAPAEKPSAGPALEPRSTPSAPVPQVATPLRNEPSVVPAPSAKADAIAPRQKLEERRAQAFAAPPPSAVTKESGSAQASRDDAAAALSVETQINTIRTLRDDGRLDDALRELARFRAAYPDADARLPSDLREWAKRSPR